MSETFEAVESQSHAWDEDDGNNGDGAHERDDEARVPDGKSQQVALHKIRAQL